MTPVPHPSHQKCNALLVSEFITYFKNKTCWVYPAPFDALFIDEENAPGNKIINIVQPDISIVCDKNKIDGRGCLGAPDLIVEMLSPSTTKKDFKEKFLLSEKYGVREYRIADPANKVIHLYKLNGEGRFELEKIFNSNESMRSSFFRELTINLAGIFG
ncbi:MAG: Uma2 family endonuclease [Spirochaetes bacterium]|nr:Uma2 family endonuclease [Spirochaetota bacterium]